MLAGGGTSCDALEDAEDEPDAGSGFDVGVAMLGRRGGGGEWNDGGPRLRVEKAGGRRLLVENAGGCEYGVVVIRHRRRVGWREPAYSPPYCPGLPRGSQDLVGIG